MATTQHRLPSIAATSTARNAFGRETLTVAKNWASRSDLTGFTENEIRTAYTLLLSNEQALKPFYSPERTAFRKLSAEVKRRGLELDA